MSQQLNDRLAAMEASLDAVNSLLARAADEGADIPAPPTHPPPITTATGRTPGAGTGREVSLSQLGEHRSAESGWIAIHGQVYDVSAFLDAHPGGRAVLLGACGTDASAEFDAIHKGGLETLAEFGQDYIVGTLSPPAAEPATAEAAAGGEKTEAEGKAEEALEGGVPARVISDCHFRKIGTEYDRKPGIKWLSCTGK
jgi:predicted heme/steroid binding protein